MADQPNILFVQTDQLAIDVLAAWGNPIAITPHIDDVAAAGTVFDIAYCNFPLCAPSRMSMATGLLASRIGAYDNATEFPATIPSYAHYMRKLGYRTCLSGKMHFVGPDQLHGFERRLTTDIYPSDFAWTPDWSHTGFHGATDTSVLTDSGVCRRNVQIDYDEDVTHKAIQEIYDAARAEDGSTLSVPLIHDGFIQMKGRKVFSEAVRSMVASLNRACDRAGIGIDDLRIVVPHQANQRILDAVQSRVAPPVYSNIRHQGNTSSSSIPLCLEELLPQVSQGERLGLCAFGGGFTFGAGILEAN